MATYIVINATTNKVIIVTPELKKARWYKEQSIKSWGKDSIILAKGYK